MKATIRDEGGYYTVRFAGALILSTESISAKTPKSVQNQIAWNVARNIEVADLAPKPVPA